MVEAQIYYPRYICKNVAIVLQVSRRLIFNYACSLLINNQVLRKIKIAVESDVKTGRI